MIKATVWTEDHKQKEHIKAVYPRLLCGTIADFLNTDEEIEARIATLDMPECGLPDEILNDTDVLLWWGHSHHEEVPDELVEKIYKRVMGGMGIIFLHSAHMSKPFRRLMGTTCTLQWRDGDRERLWNIYPEHPIAQGVPEYVNLPAEEMYGEKFDIPKPDEIIFLGWFSGGEVFRSGCTWQRGKGRVFYFQPGHETNPSFHNEVIQKIITNAVKWAKPSAPITDKIDCPHAKISPEEMLKSE